MEHYYKFPTKIYWGLYKTTFNASKWNIQAFPYPCLSYVALLNTWYFHQDNIVQWPTELGVVNDSAYVFSGFIYLILARQCGNHNNGPYNACRYGGRIICSVAGNVRFTKAHKMYSSYIVWTWLMAFLRRLWGHRRHWISFSQIVRGLMTILIYSTGQMFTCRYAFKDNYSTKQFWEGWNNYLHLWFPKRLHIFRTSSSKTEFMYVRGFVNYIPSARSLTILTLGATLGRVYEWRSEAEN